MPSGLLIATDADGAAPLWSYDERISCRDHLGAGDYRQYRLTQAEIVDYRSLISGELGYPLSAPLCETCRAVAFPKGPNGDWE